ncbi:MAG: hypothetical protein FJY55_04925 [Betaproteobacteria bacterium]|nr:hypothetical protein [Betaproteobacteria bacterium]
MAHRHLARAAIALALVVALGGCTAVRIAYNNADTLVRYMASDYVELEPAQQEEFRVRLARFHDWHRASELPAYAALLTEVARRAADGVDATEVAWAAAELRVRYRHLARRAAAEAAPLLAGLSAAQIDDVERKLAEGNAKYAAERYLDDPRRRQRHAARQMRKQFSDWLGSLSVAQEDRIGRFVQAHDAILLLRYEDRKRRQRAGMRLIRAGGEPAALAELLAEPEIGRAPELAAAAARHESGLTQLVVEIVAEASPDQRAHALRRLESYARDFQVLAGQKAVAAAP